MIFFKLNIYVKPVLVNFRLPEKVNKTCNYRERIQNGSLRLPKADKQKPDKTILTEKISDSYIRKKNKVRS